MNGASSNAGGTAPATESASFNLFQPLKGRFGITMLVGFVLGLGMQLAVVEWLEWHPFTGLMVYWLTLAYVYLIPTWMRALRPNLQAAVKSDGRDRRSGGVLLIPAVGFELLIVALVLPRARSLEPKTQVLLVSACAVALASAWLVTQTAFAIHYAWLYYRGLTDNLEVLKFSEAGSPGATCPGYWDFFYFACAVGTTFGTTDVQVASQEVRKTVLRHGLLSFVVNTVILAMVVSFLGSYMIPQN